MQRRNWDYRTDFSKHTVAAADALLQVKRCEHRFVFQAQADLQIGSLSPDTLDQASVNLFAGGATESKPPVVRLGWPAIKQC